MKAQEKSASQILVLTHDAISLVRAGGVLRTLEVADEFLNRGYNVMIFMPFEGDSNLVVHNHTKLRPLSKEYSQLISVIRFNMSLFIKILKYINRESVVFVHNTIAAVFIPLLKSLFHFNFILDITDIHTEYLGIGKNNLLEKILKPFLVKYEYYIIRAADRLIVVTHSMKNLLISKGVLPEKISVVYDGVDIRNVSSKKDKGAEWGVIHLGAIDRQHGVDVFIRAIPIVIKSFPEARFYFVGGGRELQANKKLALEIGVFDKCIFTDWLACETAREFLRLASIGIISRRNVLANQIVTTLKIYEYWTSGTAVISTQLKGVSEIAFPEENILWFDSGDHHSLANSINRLLGDTNLKQKLINNGLKSVINHNFCNLAVKVVDHAVGNPREYVHEKR